jgi:DNA-binding GntR family transcriptional regulator
MGLATLRQVRRPLLADDVAAQIRKAIVSGKFKPGEPLAEPVLAARLGVSRGPVREALITLERDGLVQFAPSGRTRVRQFDERDFEEIISLRGALEGLASRLACRHWNEALAAVLAANLEQQQRATTLGEFSRLDTDLHEAIVRASAHERLIAAWLVMRPQLEMWLTHSFELQLKLHHELRNTTVAAHRELLGDLASKDEERAARSATSHIDAWRKLHAERQPQRRRRATSRRLSLITETKP